jgi:hypothetical protein
VTIDILASREDGEDLLAETKFIMVARYVTRADFLLHALFYGAPVPYLDVFTNECEVKPLSIVIVFF